MPFKGRTILPVSWKEINIPSTVIKCPHCRVKSHFTPTTHARGYEGKRAWVVQKCDNCKRLALTIFQLALLGSLLKEVRIRLVCTPTRKMSSHTFALSLILRYLKKLPKIIPKPFYVFPLVHLMHPSS